MTETAGWLLAMEVLGAASLPLTLRMFQALPDLGYAFGKILGLLLLTWVIWLAGSVLPAGNNVPLLWSVLLVGGAASWLLGGGQALASLRSIRSIAGTEEALFIVAFVGWAAVRSLHPDIAGTEKPMDLMLLQSSSVSARFPPQDLWLAGHSVNYYYLGYLVMAVAGHLAAVSPLAAFNLAQAFIFALAVSCSYGLAYTLMRSRLWAGLGPLFIVLLGNSYSLFLQVLQGKFPWTEYQWYWDSSRVVGEISPGQATTINEFPMFSFVLGDLHAHLMALPVGLLSVAIGLSLYLQPPWRPGQDPTGSHASSIMQWPVSGIVRLLVGGIGIGSLIAINTWDFPTYLGVALGLLFLRAWRDGHARGMSIRSWRPALGASCVLVATALVGFIGFKLSYHPSVGGPAGIGLGPVKLPLGFVSTSTDPAQLALVFGFPALLLGGLIVAVAGSSGILTSMAQLVRRPQTPSARVSEAGQIRAPAVPAAVLAIPILASLVTARWVLAAALFTGLSCLSLALSRRVRDGDAMVLALGAVAVLIVAVPEVFYLPDSFQGGTLYRMNTVFKFYFQAWVLLGLGGAYAVYRVRAILAAWAREAATSWLAIATLGAACGLTYTILGPLSYYVWSDPSNPIVKTQALSGMGFLAAADPGDYRAIRWLRAHVPPGPVVLEATGGGYSTFARVSTFTGLPTPLGWADHEYQWRGGDQTIAERQQLVNEIYSTGDIHVARRLIRQNHIGYVYVGPCERQIYASSGGFTCGDAAAVPSPAGALTKFGSFMAIAYRAGGVVIYRRK